MRILCLDIGSKRIGMALSDELGFTAQGLGVLNCKNAGEDVKRIAALVREHGVTEIVVGIPYNMNGTEGPQVQKVRAFMELIGRATDIPLRDWDERLSTVAAERALLEADMSRAKRRKVIDKLSAVIILQGYLDSQHFKGVSNS
ncbi:MAG TPA: Holliday junction resolvase RuvX [Desulfomonilaceae bacterium]|nr:Holliday junction resolvase RuvX [Desulfomonilaceae bacterium]